MLDGILRIFNSVAIAGYARVSTDDEEQLGSYEAQIDSFTKKIKENDEWIFAGMYADKGKSWTLRLPITATIFV